MKNLYERAVLIRLRATQKTWTVQSAEARQAIASQTGADIDSVTGGKKLLPPSVMRQVRRPVELARKALRENGVPWSASRGDAEGLRKEDGWWLVHVNVLPELEAIFRECRQMREQGEMALWKRYDRLVVGARMKLGTLFREEDFPPLDEVKKMFTWNVDIQPLFAMENVANDLRVRLPSSWADEQIQQARDDERRKLANAVAAAAAEVMDFAEKTVVKLRDHDLGTEDKRSGQSFKEGPLRRNIAGLAERMKVLDDMLEDPALSKVTQGLDGLVSKLDTLSKGALQHDEDGSLREEVAKDLDDVVESARPAMDRLATLFGE